MASTPQMELESLFVRIFAKAEEFFGACQNVEQRFENLHRNLVSRSAALSTQVSANLGAVGNSLALIGGNIANLERLQLALEGFSFAGGSLVNLSATLGNIGGFMRDIPNVAGALRDLERINEVFMGFGENLPAIRAQFTNLSAISSTITRFMSRVEGWREQMGGLTNSIARRMDNFADKLPAWSVQFGQLDAIAAGFMTMTTGIRRLEMALPMLGNIDQAMATFTGRMPDYLTFMRAFGNQLAAISASIPANAQNLVALGGIGPGLVQFATSMQQVANVGTDPMKKAASALNAFGGSLSNQGFQTLLTTNFANLLDLPVVGTSLANFSQGIAATDLSKLDVVADQVQKFGRRMGTTGFQKRLDAIIKLEELQKAAVGLEALNKSLSGLNFSGLDTVADALQTFGRRLNTKSIQALFANMQNMSQLPALGEFIARFNAHLTGVNAGNLNAVANALNAASGMGFKLNQQAPKPPASGFGVPGGAMAHNLGFAIENADKFGFQFQLLRYGMYGFGIISVLAFARFDEAIGVSIAMMDRFQGSIAETRRQFTAMIMQISSRSITGPMQLASGLGFLARGGLSATESLQALAVAERFSVSGMMDMQHASQALTTIMQGFGMGVGDMERIGNVLVDSVRAAGGRGTVEQMSEAMSRLAPTAHFLGISFEEVAGALSVMAQQGIVGSEAASSLGRVLNQLETVAVRNQAVWNNWGLNVFQVGTHRLLPLNQIFAQLRDRMQGMTDAGRRYMLMELGLGESGGTGLIRGLSALTARPHDILVRQQRFLGTGQVMDEITATRLQSFSGQMANLWNNIQIAAISVGEMLVPALSMLAGILRIILNIINSIPAPIRGLLGMMLALTLAGWASHRMLGMLGLAWSTFIAFMNLGTAAFSRVTLAQMSATVATVRLRLAYLGLALILFTILDLFNRLSGQRSVFDQLSGMGGEGGNNWASALAYTAAGGYLGFRLGGPVGAGIGSAAGLATSPSGRSFFETYGSWNPFQFGANIGQAYGRPSDFFSALFSNEPWRAPGPGGVIGGALGGGGGGLNFPGIAQQSVNLGQMSLPFQQQFTQQFEALNLPVAAAHAPGQFPSMTHLENILQSQVGLHGAGMQGGAVMGLLNNLRQFNLMMEVNQERMMAGQPMLPFTQMPGLAGMLPPILGGTYRQVDLAHLDIEGPGGLSRGVGAEGGGGIRVHDPQSFEMLQRIAAAQREAHVTGH